MKNPNNGIDEAFMLFGDGWYVDPQMKRIYDECQDDRRVHGIDCLLTGFLRGLMLGIAIMLAIMLIT